jgi:hypothetical protein
MRCFSNRFRAVCAAALILLIVGPVAHGWDEVSHIHLVDLAIPLVEDEDLRDILETHADLVRFGSWYPDWGQYGDHPFNEGSHREVPAGYLAYVMRDDVRASGDHERLLAHFMGAYSHVVGDNFLDSTIYTYMRELDEGLSGDMRNGIMNIRLHGFLDASVRRAYPYDHLRRLYAELGYFERDGVSPDEFETELNHHTRIQFLQLRALKLLSLFGSGYVQSSMPWGAAHMYDAPGGFRDNARAMAAVWDALWDEIQGRDAPLFVHSLPAEGGVLPSPDNTSLYGRITLVSAKALDPEKISPDTLRLERTLPNGAAVPVEGQAGLYPYDAEAGSYAHLALQFVPAEPLVPGARYRLRVASGEYGMYAPAESRGYSLPFTVSSMPDTRTRTPRFGVAMGLFLFVLLGSLGGMVFGLPAILGSAIGSGRARPHQSSVEGRPAARRVGRIVGYAVSALGGVVFLLGLIMLIDRGRRFIEFLLDVF